MTGNLRALDEKDLLLLYYGGNKNLFDFIKRHYPLLENMQAKDKYATKAMEYYRQLLRSKAYDEPEPNMPAKKKAYTSIFQKKVSPSKEQREQREQREQKHKNLRKNRMMENDDRDNEDNDEISGTKIQNLPKISNNFLIFFCLICLIYGYFCIFAP